MSDLLAAAGVAAGVCLGLKPGEKALVVTDPETAEVGAALWQGCHQQGGEALLLTMTARRMHAEEPPAPVAAAMRAADVCLLATSKSLSHTRARREAAAAGARVASLPGISAGALIRAAQVDYPAMAALSRRLAAILSAGRQAEVITAGHSLTFSLAGRQAVADTGLYLAPGAFGNLPAGEAYLAPVEGTASGRVAVDGSMAGLGRLTSPLVLEFAGGCLAGVSGGPQAAELEQLLAPYGQPGRNLAELGVGTNAAAILTGSPLEDEKILGSIHVALGNNLNFGGSVEVPLHLDAIALKPTLIIDGRLVVEDGRIAV